MRPNGQQAPSLTPTPTAYSHESPYSGNNGPTPFTAINGTIPQKVQPIPEDWSFLESFGDPTDDFYTLDAEFRGLLDGEFASGNSRFI
jgi:hypothetical protein